MPTHPLLLPLSSPLLSHPLFSPLHFPSSPCLPSPFSNSTPLFLDPFCILFSQNSKMIQPLLLFLPVDILLLILIWIAAALYGFLNYFYSFPPPLLFFFPSFYPSLFLSLFILVLLSFPCFLSFTKKKKKKA
jgi:hypothetical protein